MQSPEEKHHGGESSKMSSDICKSENGKKSPPGSRTPPTPGTTSPPVSDDTCSICLGTITDRCVAGSCHHYFCFLCLKEWSKQKAVCPLCKEAFTTIMYDIKSDFNYKVWKVPKNEQRSEPMAEFHAFFVADRRFFGYRTTNFNLRSLRRQFGEGVRSITDVIPPGPPEPTSVPYRLRGSSGFRRNIYTNNVWVRPMPDITGRYRETSPELYREQPALTHRLVPWVNRELAALVPPTSIGVILTEIMDLIERYPINSREFRRAIRPHLGIRTNHFVHEFFNFARSPYDLVGHDSAARYVARYDNYDADSSNGSSTEDSDAVVEVDVRGNPVSDRNSGGQQGPTDYDNVDRGVLTQEASLLISSDENSSNEFPQQSNLFTQVSALQSSIDEPHTSSASTVSRLLGRARHFLNAVNEGASTSAGEGVLNNSNARNASKREIKSDSDEDGCVIVEEVTKRQPTPEIITLDSEEENYKAERPSKHKTRKSSAKDRVGPSTSHSNHKKGKKKISLNRKNFPQSRNDTSNPSKQWRKDHGYCSELKAEEPDRCCVRKRCNCGSSEPHQSAKHLQASEDESDSFTLSSDSDVNSQEERGQRINHKEREPMDVLQYDSSNQDCSGSSFLPDRSSRRSRKDHKSKVKKSFNYPDQVSLYQRHNHGQQYNHSGTSGNSWCSTDAIETPSCSSWRESSSWDDHCQDGSSSEWSPSYRSLHKKDRKDKRNSSKSKCSNRREKHKKDKHKGRHKKEKNRHRKKYKSKKTVSSCSDSESSESSDRVSRHKRKRNQSEDAVILSIRNNESKAKKIRYDNYSSSD